MAAKRKAGLLQKNYRNNCRNQTYWAKAGAYLVQRDGPGLGIESWVLASLQLASVLSWGTFLGPGTAEKLDAI